MYVRKSQLENEKKKLKKKINALNEEIFMQEHKSVLQGTKFNDITGTLQTLLYSSRGLNGEEFKKAMTSW